MESKNYIDRAVESYCFDPGLVGRHMVFIAGPRQVGKTMLARARLKTEGCGKLYFNWDDPATRNAYYQDHRFFESPARSLDIENPLIVFDEIHKRNQWKDILKGIYDVFGDTFRFLVTGSARLDMFRRSGDSLVGRYNLFHMMPLNIREFTGTSDSSCFLATDDMRAASFFEATLSQSFGTEMIDGYRTLAHFGPFPEPALRQHERFCRKWHQDYAALLLHQDLRDISKVTNLDKVEHLFSLLGQRIMAPLSMANIGGELEVSHTTVKSWLEQLKRLYLVFPVKPWSKKVSRGLRKEKKWYYLDWYYAPSGPARIENMTATYLYRTCLVLTDMGYGRYSLKYVRTLDKKEIDFLVVRDNIPLLAVEVKSGSKNLSPSLAGRSRWFRDTPVLGVQVIDKRDILKKHDKNTWMMSIERFLSLLP